MTDYLDITSRDSVVRHISSYYQESDAKWGWDLLFGPYINMCSPRYPVAFFGLNPGGPASENHQVSVEGKCAYYNEVWPPYPIGEAPLQKQLGIFYSMIADVIGVDVKSLMDGSLMTNYIPARSPSWSKLPDQDEWIQCGRQIWSQRISKVHCKVYVAISCVVFNELHNHLVENGYKQVGDSVNERVNWWYARYQIHQFERDGNLSVLIRLPHLSSYKIFSRTACQPAIKRIMESIESVLR